ncbi:MAG: hypothetical protein J3Q66DRAFT_405257 [Benniella sp.]|nr:MAG: hypothetical protein J3Q66DRAFT_405257 [Benniella sp.]
MNNTNITSLLQANIHSDSDRAPSTPHRPSSSNLSPDINFMAQALNLPHGTLSTPVLTQGHAQQYRSSLEQSYAVLSWPFTPESTPFMTLQRLLAQLQQQLSQQQQQIQQIQFMQQQYAQSTVFPQSPLFSHPQTLPQQHSLLDDELPSIQPGLGVPLENQDGGDQSQYQEELRMTDLLFTPELSRGPLPMIDHSLEVPHGQGTSSSNEDLVSATHGRSEEETHTTTRPKRPRKPLQIRRRLEVIDYWETSEDKSITALSRVFGIPRSTLYGIISARDELKNLVEELSHLEPTLERRYRVSGLRPRNLEEP